MAVKKIDDAVKARVIKDYADGVSKKEIAEKFGISVSSVSRIVKANPSRDVQKDISGPAEKTERQKKIEDIKRRILLLEKKILAREARKKT